MTYSVVMAVLVMMMIKSILNFVENIKANVTGMFLSSNIYGLAVF